MRRVLIVSAVFPPMAYSGVYRTVKFVKYLPTLGWQPSVLVVDRPNPEMGRDESLCDEVPDGVEVVRVGADPLRPLYKLANRLSGRPRLGADHGRLRAALRAGRRLCRERSFDALYVSVPPKRLPLLGLALARESGLPLVLDYRDPPWELEENWQPRADERAWFAARSAELWERADLVIANTEPVRDAMRERLGIAEHKLCWIPNGYDEADFARVATPAVRERGERFEVCCLAQPREGEELDAFVAALETVSEDAEFRAHFRLRIHGPERRAVRRALAHFIDDGRIEICGLGGHLEVVRAMLEADANLLFFREQSSRLRVPQKLYQYLRAGRPVLAMLAPGPGARLVEESGLGRACDPKSRDAIATGLREVFGQWRDGAAPPPPPRPWLERFVRRHPSAAI